MVGASPHTPKVCGFDRRSGSVWEAIDVSLTLMQPPKKSTNTSSGKDKIIIK